MYWKRTFMMWGGRKICPGITTSSPFVDLWLTQEFFSSWTWSFFPLLFVCLFVCLFLHLLFKIFTWLTGEQIISETKSTTGIWLVSYKQYSLWVVQSVSPKANQSQSFWYFYSAFGKVWEQGNLLSFLSCMKSHKYILFPFIYGKCLLLLLCFWFSLTWAWPMNQFTWPHHNSTVVLRLCNENLFPETAGASQMLTCRQTMVWLFFPPTGCSSLLWGYRGAKQMERQRRQIASQIRERS